MSITRCCKYLGFPIASKVFSKVAFPCLKDFFFYCMLNLQYSLSKNSTLIEKPPIKNPGSSLLLSDQVSPVHPGFSSVQFSHSVMSDSLRPCELQPARPLCPSPTPGTYPNSCPLSWWCHPTISSSVIPFSSCPQSFPASGSFPVSQLFASGGQSIGSFSFNISPSNEYSGLISFRMDWLDLLAVQGTLKSLLQHLCSKGIYSWALIFPLATKNLFSIYLVF